MASSNTAARLSLAAAATFLVLLAALHVLRPELDPSWRVISEYAIGSHGWMMGLAFLSLAFCCITLCVAIRPQVRTAGGRIGLALLLVSAAGMTMAAIFTTDPLTASAEARTTSGKLHELGAMLDVTPIAAALISWSLAGSEAWSRARRWLIWTTGLVWIGLLAFIGSVAVMLPKNGGEFGPEVPIGWPNRFMMLTYCGWLMTVAWRAMRHA